MKKIPLKTLMPLLLLLSLSAFACGGGSYTNGQPPAKPEREYKIPRQLTLEQFQHPKEGEILEKLNTKKIPPLPPIVPYIRDKIQEGKIGETLDGGTITDLLISGVEVTEKQFPALRRRIDLCAKILHLETPPRAFIVSHPDTKIYVTNFQNPILVIHTPVILRFSAEELQFLIGRQLGHIKSGHVFYSTMFNKTAEVAEMLGGRLIPGEIFDNLLDVLTDSLIADWIETSEMSADRAGLIACQDVSVATQTLVRLKLGVSTAQLDINVDEYLKQHNEVGKKEIPGLSIDLIRVKVSRLDPPFVPSRIQSLRDFYRSQAYRRIFE